MKKAKNIIRNIIRGLVIVVSIAMTVLMWIDYFVEGFWTDYTWAIAVCVSLEAAALLVDWRIYK